MKEYATDRLRNIALVGHNGSGKTALAEAALFLSGTTTRMGKTEDGNTVSDFDPEEVRRGGSIHTSVIPVEWEGHKLNLLDTPGYADFVGEVISALRAADGAAVVIDSVAGVEVGTEIVWQHLDDLNLPRLVVINKMDRDNADWKKVMRQLEASFEGVRFVPLQVPIGNAQDFRGVFRLISEQASLGQDGKKGDVPDEVKAEAESIRESIVEAAAESDDELIMKYLDGEGLTDDEVRGGLVSGAKAGKYVPVFFTSGTEAVGVNALLHYFHLTVPSPIEAPPRKAGNPAGEGEIELRPDAAGPLAAYVFKTHADPYVGKLQYLRVCSGAFDADSRVYNHSRNEEERIGPVYLLCAKEQTVIGRIPPGDIGAVAKLQHTETGDTLGDKDTPLTLPDAGYPQPLFSVALKPATQADAAKVGGALHRLVEEDPTLRWHHEAATRELILSGMGEAHIDVAVRHMKENFGVEVNTLIPRVPYRETVSRSASAQYRHKKQTGGAGQFAEVHLRVEPLARGSDFEFASEVFGGAISQQFVSSVEKGIRAILADGVVAHCPVVDTKAVVYDGKEHPVDSKDIAFQIAGREAFKAAVHDAGPVLLEPIYEVKVTVPSSQMGDVLGDLNSRRGHVQGTEQVGNKAIVTAYVPLAEMRRYSTDLRSMTQGRGYYIADLHRYEPVPHQLAGQIIAKAREEAEEEDA